MTPLTMKFPDRNSAELFMEWLKLQGKEQYEYYMNETNQEKVTFIQFDFRNLVIDTRKENGK